MSKHPSNASRVCKIEWLENRCLMSVTYGSNLILNPGAEAYDGTADGFNIITPNHWTANGNPTVVKYKGGYAATILIRKPDNGSDAFFAGGPDDESDDLFQSIDLSSIATAIDAGQVQFKLGALIGGNLTDDDNATVSVNFREASQAVISEFGTASVSAGDRDDRSKFVGRTRAGAVPADSRFAQIQIHFKRDDGSYNDGFADNLSLVLSTSTPSTVGITPTLIKSTFKPTVIAGQKISASIALNLQNTSTSINKGLDTISLLASSTGLVDSNSIVIATTNQVLNLGAGKSTRLTLAVKTLSLAAGTYTIFAQTKDSFGTVVTTASGPIVTVSAPIISLSATIGTVVNTSVKNQDIFNFPLIVTNVGNVDSTGLATIMVGFTDPAGEINYSTTLKKRVTVKAGGKPIIFRFKESLLETLIDGGNNPVASLSQGGITVVAETDR